MSVVALNGFIYAMGGFNGEIRLNTVERYDPTTNQWTLIESMNYVRSDAHSCVLDSKIYIVGKAFMSEMVKKDIFTCDSMLKVDSLVNFAFRQQKCLIRTRINGQT